MLETDPVSSVIFGIAFVALPLWFVGVWIHQGVKRFIRFWKGELKNLDEQEARKAFARSRSGDRTDEVYAEELNRRAARRAPSSSSKTDGAEYDVEYDAECDALAARIESR